VPVFGSIFVTERPEKPGICSANQRESCSTLLFASVTECHLAVRSTPTLMLPEILDIAFYLISAAQRNPGGMHDAGHA
jgi:hypothetical protein